MSSPPNATHRTLEGETSGVRSGEGRNSKDTTVVKRRPNPGAPAPGEKPNSLQVVKSYGRHRGQSGSGIDSGAEKAEGDHLANPDNFPQNGAQTASSASQPANLYNASNMPKETWKQVEQFEADLRKNPKDVEALVGWGRLLVKVARDVIATHASPESVKNVRSSPSLLLFSFCDTSPKVASQRQKDMLFQNCLVQRLTFLFLFLLSSPFNASISIPFLL